jgi:hypothetical protein
MRCRLRGLPLAYGILAARTQDEIPDAADQVFVSALANGKVYIAYGSIRPKVQIAACSAIRAGYNKRAEAGGEDAFKRCFAQRAPQQPSFAEATKQAQALLAMAMGP